MNKLHAQWIDLLWSCTILFLEVLIRLIVKHQRIIVERIQIINNCQLCDSSLVYLPKFTNDKLFPLDKRLNSFNSSNHTNMKKYNHFLRIFLLTIFVLTGFFSCKNNSQPVIAEKMPPSLASYIYAYTSGTISKVDAIKIRFVQPMVDKEKIGQNVPSGLLKFSPNIKGTTNWENEQTLIFTPEEQMNSNTQYLAELDIRQLVKNLDSSINNFQFNFKTKENYLDLRVEGLSAISNANPAVQQLNGVLITGDIIDGNKIGQVLTAFQKGEKLPIEFNSEGFATEHNFTVKNIQRTDQASEVVLSLNGKELKINQEDTRKIAVPSINEFLVNNVQVTNLPEQQITIFFSDPILKDQDFSGRFQVNGINTKFKTLVDGNKVKLFPSSQISGNQTLVINAGILNSINGKLEEKINWEVSFMQENPQVKMVGSGNVLPDSKGLIFPFDAVGLTAVDIEIFKIYNNNILQFFQHNDLSGNYRMEMVGDIIHQKKFDLSDLNPAAKPNAMTRYAVDLKPLIDQDPAAIYQVRIGFKQSYAIYNCGENDSENNNNNSLTVLESQDPDAPIRSFWNRNVRHYDGYTWRHREDPCYSAYYQSSNFVRRNILSSNLGMIAKRGNDGSVQVILNDLRTTNSIPKVEVILYDYAQQKIETKLTDGNGMANFNTKKEPFVAVANFKGQRGYLKIDDGANLSLSRFDVAGVAPQKGMKGYIYGERGVWRPGDSLYLNFVLEDKSGRLPEDHPVRFTLKDPRGQTQQSFVSSTNVNGVYPLHVATSTDAPTGNWVATVALGGATFRKSLKIETVKPNRLKIKLDFGKETLGPTDENLAANLKVNWLHGAPGKNLKAKIESQMKSVKTSFPSYTSFVFDDPARKFNAEPQVIFDGSVNGQGVAAVTTKLNRNADAPGKLKISFKSRAFEQGGDFSTDNFTMEYSPYTRYAGIEIPRNEYNSKRLDYGKDQSIDLVLVDSDGNPVPKANLDVGLYRVEWRWWWDRDGYRENAQYNVANHNGSLIRNTVVTDNNGIAKFKFKLDEWGRYLVRACDRESGHCTGDFFYAGYPWYDEEDSGMREAAAMLSFSSGKKIYQLGEDIEIKIPASEDSRCLISIENGTKILQTIWKNAKAGDNIFKIPTTVDMTPNIFVNVTLLQAHGQNKNDLGIRMYGVIPVTVENPATKLAPKIEMPDVLEPKGKFAVKVSESNGKPMTYTVAVVDEGLLDLTRFKTPNPWDRFYAREALGVNTWDMYDHVLGAYGGDLKNILSIGGDGEVVDPNAAKKANRFKPVVQHLGPFYLAAGESATHEMRMPNYVGSVRTMVVASGDLAYGKTEKTTAVKKPLMILATLPRVLGPTESLNLPVNVFAMENNIRDVQISVKELSGLGKFSGGTTQQLTFNEIGDQMANFSLDVANRTGPAKFLVTATSGGESATQEIEIEIRNPNPPVTNVYDGSIAAGKNWEQSFDLAGMPGTNETILEVSGIPPLNLGKRLRYLIRYPHGCIEQTTSAAFPQLYVGKLLEMSTADQNRAANNVKAAISKINRYQRTDGSFSYWPGGNYYSDYGSNYAGHFLLEAKKAGYVVPTNLLNQWQKSTAKYARNWRYTAHQNDRYYRSSNTLNQAYRLYNLALSGHPEWGAMNRLQEMNLPIVATWRLALAYAEGGKPEIARGLIQGLSKKVDAYQELGGSYGSDVRDEAMILETLVALNDKEASAAVVRSLSERLSTDRWYNTQATAYSLLAIAKFVGQNQVGKEIKFEYALDGGSMVSAGSTSPVFQIDLPEAGANQSVKVVNTGANLLFVRVIQTGQPTIGDPNAVEKNLNMSIAYQSMAGTKIDPTRIEQGTDFIAEIKITNPGTRGMRYEELALSQIFPSGWEIQNTRMDAVGQTANTDFEYQDIRDDRVYTYFDLDRKTTQTYRVQLNAAYPGKYYLPTVSCEAMYDQTIQARVPGMWVEVLEDTGI